MGLENNYGASYIYISNNDLYTHSLGPRPSPLRARFDLRGR